MAYCMYLRKSRKDLEAEAHGEGETLLRHEKMLLEMADRMGLDVPPEGIYREVVSGDTIVARPEIQRLLQDVQDGRWQGCLVTEISRLARGDSIDQGIVMQTFKFARVSIIVYPGQLYNPQNDFDETALEMSLFLARQEYKVMRRRMQAGRAASVREGHYVGGKRPYGYQVEKIKGNKGYTLVPDPEESQIVRQVFRWYVHENVGAANIANRLNALGVRTYNGCIWDANRIRSMLSQPVYAGFVQWLKREERPTIIDGRKIKTRPFSERYILAKGLHEPLVPEEDYYKAREIAAARLGQPVKKNYALQAPLAGLIKCGLCGKAMVRRTNLGHVFCSCRTPGCPCSSARYELVVELVVDALRKWVLLFGGNSPAVPVPAPADPGADAVAIAQKALDSANRQLAVAKSMLEKEVYSVDEYLERKQMLAEKIRAAEAELSRLRASAPAPSMESAIRALLPRVQEVLAAWPYTQSPQEQNALLRSVLSRIDYSKTHPCHRNEDPRDYITISLYPLVSSSDE